MAVHKIFPHRFSAIYGWDLSAEAFRNLGVKFLPGMSSHRWITNGYNGLSSDFLREDCYGKTIFCHAMTPGAIGCTLSHLSVLQDAYDSNYETIWVAEDDISLQGDPHMLAKFIDQLDALVGKDGWDILYADTDSDTSYFENISGLQRFLLKNDFESDLKGDLSFVWRPDIKLPDLSHFAKRTILSDEFVQIGNRARTHSMIIRRSGMKKILDFEKTHHIFLPYDHEIATVPNIKLINLRKNLITFSSSPSDTEKKQFDPKNSWGAYKEEILKKASQITGWFDASSADKLMEFIHAKKPTTCVEIGAFAGSTTYQIASVLSFLQKGLVYAIDPWDTQSAIEGLNGENLVQWWKSVSMESVQAQFQSLFSQSFFANYCRAIKQRADLAASAFSNESIDLLYVDGNDSEDWNLENITLYFPKIKEGGYICLNKPLSKNKTVAFLMKNCQLLKDSSSASCLVFQKKPIGF